MSKKKKQQKEAQPEPSPVSPALLADMDARIERLAQHVADEQIALSALRQHRAVSAGDAAPQADARALTRPEIWDQVDAVTMLVKLTPQADGDLNAELESRSLDERARGPWKADLDKWKPKAAVIVQDNRVLAVYDVHSWHKATAEQIARHPKDKGRRCFVGERNAALEAAWLGRDTTALWLGSNPVEYTHREGRGPAADGRA